MSTPFLHVSGLKVVFDGFTALDLAELAVAENELRFLIGPNGAGKTTLVDVITGLTRPAEGSVRLDGAELVGRREHQIVRLGVGRTFQTATVFDELTVGENLDLAASYRLSKLALMRRRRGTAEQVAEALELTGMTDLADQPAITLSHGRRQWLEIGMVLVQRPRLLLLDEPVAGMSQQERERTGELLTSIVQRHTVIVIEHDMAFVRAFANTVTVLHEGRVLTEGTMAAVQADPGVQRVYLGRSRAAETAEAT